MRFFVLALALAVPGLLFAESPAATQTARVSIGPKTVASLYPKAGSNQGAVGRLVRNETVKVLAKDTVKVSKKNPLAPWYLVMNSAGLTGWVDGRHLSLNQNIVQLPRNVPLLPLLEKPDLPLVPDIRYSTVVYQGPDGFIYVRNDLLGGDKKIGPGRRQVLSPDRLRVAYNQLPSGPLTVYDIAKGASYDAAQPGISSDYIWYSNPKYIVASEVFGGSPRCSVYDSASLKYLTSFPFSLEVHWLDDETLLAQTLRNVVYKDRQNNGIKEMTEISLIDMRDLKRKSIAKATPYRQYFIVSGVPGGVIYSETSVRAWGDWKKGNQKMAYWNWTPKKKTEVSFAEASKRLETYTALLDAYGMEDSGSSYMLEWISRHPKDPNWLMFIVRPKDLNDVRSYVCIANAQDPKGSIRKVADGAFPAW